MNSRTLVVSLVLVVTVGAAVTALAIHQSPRLGSFGSHSPVVMADAVATAAVVENRITVAGDGESGHKRGPHYRRA